MGNKSRGNFNIPFCIKSGICKFYSLAPEKCASCFNFSRFIEKYKTTCDHPGCRNHKSHPCEKCKGTNGKN
jgi:hypothetical protein